MSQSRLTPENSNFNMLYTVKSLVIPEHFASSVYPLDRNTIRLIRSIQFRYAFDRVAAVGNKSLPFPLEEVTLPSNITFTSITSPPSYFVRLTRMKRTDSLCFPKMEL